MAMHANLYAEGVADNGKYYRVSDNKNQYTTALKTSFPLLESGGRDHFVSFFDEIDILSNAYQNQGIRGTIESIKKSTVLTKWFSAVLCSFIFAYESENCISVKGIDFSVQHRYMKVWKSKFDSAGNNDNHYDDGDSQKLNIVTFTDENDYKGILGVYSEKYFVIPMKEYDLPIRAVKLDNKGYRWIEKFKYLCANSDRLDRLESVLNIKDMALIKLSANSIQDNAPTPLRLIRDLVNSLITKVDFRGMAVPKRGIINHLSFYKVRGTVDLDDLIMPNISVIKGRDNRYHALYPFSENFAGLIDRGECAVSDLGMSVALKRDERGKDIIDSVSITFTTELDMTFEHDPADTAAEDLTCHLEYEGFTYTFSCNNVISFSSIRTFCMFPNFSSGREYLCRNYTYLSLEGSLFFSEEDGKDLSRCRFKNLEGNFIFDPKSPDFKSVDLKRNNGGKVLTHGNIERPDHFIGVYTGLNDTEFYGYIVNMYEISPFLENDAAAVSLSCETEKPERTSRLDAYVDLGSSTSAVRYSVENKAQIRTDYNTLIPDNCTMRKLLADEKYAGKGYDRIFVNPSAVNISKFQSVSILYGDSVADYSVNRESYMPIEKNIGSYIKGGYNVKLGNKLSLIRDGEKNNPNPKLIVYNLCYMIACNAVVRDCSKVYIYPSLPNRQFYDSTMAIWRNGIEYVKKIFPDIEFENIASLNPNQSFYFYESVALSNAGIIQGNNTLIINVDIGDSTTDMSAIFKCVDGNDVIPCGYSSVSYAGKNLIKTTLNDVMTKSGLNADALKKYFGLVSADRFDDGILTLNNGVSADIYKSMANNLFDCFFDVQNNVHQGRKREITSTWESDVLDILSVSHLNSLDTKVVANLVLRYIALMPVISDFVKVAIKLAGDDFTDSSSVKITFFGGASKGISLIRNLDGRANNIGQKFEKYFKNKVAEFTGEGTHQVDVMIYETQYAQPGEDGKDALLKGLSKIEKTDAVDRNGNTELSCNSVQIKVPGYAIDEEDLWELISPEHIQRFGDPNSVHKLLDTENKFNFVPNVNNNINANLNKFNNYSCFFGTNEIYSRFEKYYNDLFSFFIDNGDARVDVIEILTRNFVTEDMENTISRIITSGAFPFAVNECSIYPEMVENTALMYTLGLLISEYHNPMQASEPIRNNQNRDLDKYRFGVM